ncbi:hypothetical protein, partial [Candidatus Binatus sp.]|uniref:hypothetical protein n=1 Tax=Candidatus Binatus sp. TaxID=2811406 RepID=UPI003CC5F29C
EARSPETLSLFLKRKVPEWSYFTVSGTAACDCWEILGHVFCSFFWCLKTLEARGAACVVAGLRSRA